MRACASVSGGVMFIPERIEKKIPRITKKLTNDNKAEDVVAEEAVQE